MAAWPRIAPLLSFAIWIAPLLRWEIGYMRSIDIIVDHAGFYETWGCLVWVRSREIST